MSADAGPPPGSTPSQGMAAAVGISCPVCLDDCLPHRHPTLLLPCEHMFCAGCAEPYGPTEGQEEEEDGDYGSSDGGGPLARCPVDRGGITAKVALKERGGMAYRAYLAVVVDCPRKEVCGWKGQVSDVETHMRGCAGFRCELCRAAVVPPVEMEDHVADDCPQTRIPCGIDGCEEVLPRVELEAHRAVCPKRKVSCSYPLCTHECPADDMPAHVADGTQAHLLLALDRIALLERAADSQLERLASVEKVVSSISLKSSSQWAAEGMPAHVAEGAEAHLAQAAGSSFVDLSMCQNCDAELNEVFKPLYTPFFFGTTVFGPPCKRCRKQCSAIAHFKCQRCTETYCRECIRPGD
ncbi:hypothetical protein DFJ74DRAFT_773624 [Hyaloraphidium curvatum]|nr:hypothetical protein DFJ74DRAFT_773624 [Hyaloraphidium curvatum]